MEVIPVSKWAQSHTPLSKFLIARLVQITDLREVITYRYSSTNGLILLDELYDAASFTLTRPNSIASLHHLLNECFSPDARTSLMNDSIVSKYFRPASELLGKIQSAKLDQEQVPEIQRLALEYSSAIRQTYIEKVIGELRAIDMRSPHFAKNARNIDDLLGLLVPQLLYEGYSVAFIFHTTKEVARLDADEVVDAMLRYYSRSGDRVFSYFVPGALDHGFAQELQARGRKMTPPEFRRVQPTRYRGYAFSAHGKDRFAALRHCSTEAFRTLSLANPDLSPAILSVVASEPFCKSRDKYAPMSAEIGDDPLSLTFRSNTLQATLERLGKTLGEIDRAVLRAVEESLYFYHEGRSTPSVENSYILLWTALESLMGMRSSKSDAATFARNVSQAIALGAVGRRALATITRMSKAVQANKWSITLPKASPYSSQGLAIWIAWFSDQQTRDSDIDPFEILQADPLLCRQFTTLNDNWKTLGNLREASVRAQRNLSFQVERLYLVRNRIVHSGQFGRTGAYLWVHLEYYVGKLLAQGILVLNDLDGQVRADSRDLIFATMLGQYESTLDYLDRHSSKRVSAEDVLWSGLSRFPALCF